MEFVQSQHSVYRLSYHVVWVCKYRRWVLKPGVVEYIKKLMPKLSQSASQIRAKFTWLSRVYFKENVFWSRGYFVSSVGLDEEKIKHYVEFQGRQDLGQLRLKL